MPVPDFPDDDLRPPRKPSGDDVVMMWRSKGEFSKTDFGGYSSIPDSDCTNNSSTVTTIPPFPESIRNPISGTVACEAVYTCTYGSGNSGDSEIKTPDCSQNPDTDLPCGDLNCRLNHHIIPAPGNTGNSPAHQSDVVPLPGVLAVKEQDPAGHHCPA